MPDNLFPRVGYFRPPPFSEVAEHGTQHEHEYSKETRTYST
jgi:hypothetical protein